MIPVLAVLCFFLGACNLEAQDIDAWLDRLSKAQEKGDMEKMGQLIKEMKQSRGRVQDSRGSMDKPPVARDDAEKKILDVLQDMYDNQRRGMMNVPPEDGRALRILTEAVQAKHVVEIGTSNGYSGIWICLALRKTGGKLVTHDIDEGRASKARENFKRAGVSDMITLVMGDAHETVKKIKEPIDILFLDADKEGYKDYLEKLLPLVRPGGLILAHNTNMRRGMGDYLEEITSRGDVETIFLHQQGAGLGVTLKKH